MEEVSEKSFEEIEVEKEATSNAASTTVEFPDIIIPQASDGRVEHERIEGDIECYSIEIDQRMTCYSKDFEDTCCSCFCRCARCIEPPDNSMLCYDFFFCSVISLVTLGSESNDSCRSFSMACYPLWLLIIILLFLIEMIIRITILITIIVVVTIVVVIILVIVILLVIIIVVAIILLIILTVISCIINCPCIVCGCCTKLLTSNS